MWRRRTVFVLILAKIKGGAFIRNPEIVLKNLFKQSQNNNEYVFEKLYKNLYNKDFYIKAFTKLYSSHGSSTPQTDGQTLCGISDETIEKLIEQIKNEQYQPVPPKRVYLSKKNGMKRPVEIPYKGDKIVGKIIEMILTSIYKPLFNSKSYGFRHNRGCHDALLYVLKDFKGINRFIKGDIVSLFNCIDYHVLIEILRRKIKDEKFIRLIWKFLKAGYLEHGIYSKTYSGTTQGGIIGPVLANIYMHELDKYMEELTGRYDCYSKIEFKKLAYVRCADSFLIGITGSKKNCIKVKDDVTKFLYESLKLKLSQEKPTITHSGDTVKFLGYEITTFHKSARNYIKLQMPATVITKKLKELDAVRDLNETPWRGKAMLTLLNNSDLEIIQAYNKQITELYNYYKLAHNVSTEMNKFYHVIKWSLMHTLANKHKCRLKKILKNYHYNGLGDDKDKTIRVLYQAKNGKDKVCKLYHDGFKRDQQ